MIKADLYFKETLNDILNNGVWSKEPRTKWKDGTPAHYKKIHQKVFTYDISKGEYPINTLRKTALKGAFHDIEAIYIKQTNIIEEMHPSIHSWWEDFVIRENELGRSIGQTYGHTVKRYDLLNNALKRLENNPDDRRVMINLWQEQQMIEDPSALVPCAFLTKYNIRNQNGVNYLDMSLYQRSQDYMMTVSINPAQYVMLGKMISNHLTYVKNTPHTMGIFNHIVEDLHIYDRHIKYAEQVLEKEPLFIQPSFDLICEPKNFYEHTWEDFRVKGIKNITDFEERLELAI